MKNFAAGKCGMMIIGADLIGWLQSMGMKVEDIGLAPMPKGPSGKRTTSISGAHFIINPRISKAKQDAAWEYIKWQTSKEYLTSYLKYTEVNNVVNPIIIEREDVKVGEIVKISMEWLEASEESIRWSRDEFYGKSAVGVYIDKALQKIIYDPNADPEKEFRDAEETANREVLKQFNDSIKGRKNGK
jgi:multiple sugar transport system substrate-binding protein